MARLGRAQPFPPKLPSLLVPAGAATNAVAEVATATATANSATTKVATTGGVATATATATAFNASAIGGTIANAGTGSATAAAYNATVSVKPTAGRGTVTATANNATVDVPVAGVFATSASANGHYLRDQNDDPYFVQGNSPQNMVSQAPLSEMESFFADQQARGFNSAQVHLVMGFELDAESSTAPFGNNATLTPRNAGYWATIDSMFDLAETYGFTLWASVIDNITCGTALLNDTSDANAFAYGQFLGARYKDRVGLVWVFGNDVDFDDTARTNKFLQILNGIQDQGDTHLATFWTLSNPANAVTSWDTEQSVDNGYKYNEPPYYQSGDSYQLTRTGFPKPFVWFEGTYYGEKNASTTPPLSTDLELRKLAWWGITWGGCGHFFGTHEVWLFDDWTSELTADIYDQLALIPATFAVDGWQDLVPDFSHVFQTGGRGSFFSDELDTDDFSTAAFVNGGALAIVYFPTSRGSITFDTTKLTGTVTAHWFDPTNGATTSVGNPAAPTHPGNNAGGDPDWVLIFESSPDTSVSAGSASATATGRAPAASVKPTGGVATATAAAQTPAASVKPTAGVATATATANNATVNTSTQTNASAGSASATATALDATCSVKPTAGVATVTATANGATVTLANQAAAGSASATATARDATVKVSVSAEVATATATANQPAVDNGAGVATYFRIVRLSRPGVVRLRRPRLDL
jgi:hypothetical protein